MTNKIKIMPLGIQEGELKDILGSERFDAKALINLLKLQFPDCYNKDAGVWEKYTLEEHTRMVLGQFEKYYGNKELPGGIEKSMFRLILAVHDIGKPIAIANGGKHLQHQYTLELVIPFFEAIGRDEQHKAFANTLLSGDPLGPYIRGRVEKTVANQQIREMAVMAKLPVSDFFDLLCIYYKVDAGGKKSLDHLFRFDEVNGDVHFAEDVESRVGELGV